MKRRELRARVVLLAEALEDGDLEAAKAVAFDLLDELGGAIRPSGRCPECGLALWPGQIPSHRSNVHGVDPFGKAAA